MTKKNFHYKSSTFFHGVLNPDRKNNNNTPRSKMRGFQKVPDKNAGQSLIEILAALGIAVIIAAGVAISVVVSLTNSQSVISQNAGSEYAQQAMEIMRQIKEGNYDIYNAFSGNYCFAGGQTTLSATSTPGTPPYTNGPPNSLGCEINVGSNYVREVDIEKNSCDCGSDLGLATPIQVDKVTVTVAWADNKCLSSGTVLSQVSSGTTCKKGLQSRINSKYCHTAVLSSCFTRLYDLSRIYNSPVPTAVATITPIPTPTPIPTASPIPTATPTPDPISANIVAYWKLDEGSGNVIDSVAGLAGVITGTGVANLAKINRGRTFTGTIDYISVADTLNLRITGNITISAWVNPRDFNNVGYILGKEGKSSPIAGPYYLRINQNTGTLSFARGNGTTETIVTSTSGITAGVWTHVAVTMSGTTYTFYINGVSAGTGNLSATIADTGEPLILGADEHLSRLYKGTMDEVGLWKRALTPIDIAQLYNCGAGNQYPFTVGGTGPICVDIVAYWKMDESSGNVLDSVGSYTGTPTGTTVSPGKIGNGRQFSALTDKLQTNSPIITGTQDFSISAWVNYTGSVATSYIAGNYDYPATQNGLEFFISQNKLGIWINGSYSGIGAYNLSANTWYHVVATRLGSAVTLYVNGSVYSTGTIATSIVTNSNWSIGNGANYTSERFIGKIDEVGLWKRALSAPEVLNLYNCGAGNQLPFITPQNPICTGLISYYKMDEASGTSADDSLGTNNGTSTGATVTTGKISSSRNFNGANQYIDMGTGPSLNLGATFSVSAWINPTTLKNYGGIFSKVISNRSGTYSFMLASHGDGTIGVWPPAGWVFSTGGGVTEGNWNHVVWVVSGNTISYYINGVAKGSSSFAYTDVDTHNAFLGSWYSITTLYDFNGKIDEVGLWGRALTAAEVGILYNCGTGNQLPFNSGVTCGTIIGNVYTDTNSNGVKDGAETGYSGATVTLTGSLSTSATTDASGNYTFIVPASGFYNVALTVPNGYITTTTNPRNTISTPATVNFGIVVGTTPTPTPTPSSPLAVNLISYWRMNEAGGTNVADALGINLGSATGATVALSGKISSARNFSGANQYVDMGTDASLNLGTTFSVSAWINPTELKNYAGIFSKVIPNRNGTSYSFMLMSHGDGTIGAWNPGTSWLYSTGGGVTTGKWSYVTWVVSGGTISYYINGAPKGSSPYAYTDVDAHNAFLGSWYSITTLYDFNGKIDEVGLWKRALSADEVAQLYNCNSGSGFPFPSDQLNPNYTLCPGLLAYWRMDDSSSAVDASGGNNNGVLTGTMFTNPAKINGGRTFNGFSDYISFADNASLKPTSDFTIQMWCLLPSTSGQSCAITKHDPSTDSGYNLFFATVFNFQAGKGVALGWPGYTVSGSVFAPGWYHVVGVHSAATHAIYINGVQKDSMAGGPVVQNTLPLWIGRNSSSTDLYYSGTIDEVAIWNRALSGSEISALYNSGNGLQMVREPSLHPLQNVAGTSTSKSTGFIEIIIDFVKAIFSRKNS